VHSLWLGVISQRVPDGAPDILDLGCGTGRYSAAHADLFNARVIAVDPSLKMLAEARGVEAFRVTDRLSHRDRVLLMGETLQRIYIWPQPTS
jgi:SAM-dependent methyltransferase